MIAFVGKRSRPAARDLQLGLCLLLQLNVRPLGSFNLLLAAGPPGFQGDRRRMGKDGSVAMPRSILGPALWPGT